LRDVVTGQFDFDYPRCTPHANLLHAHRGEGAERGAFLHEFIEDVDMKCSAPGAADGKSIAKRG
jgi:hypothetical protein